MKQFIKKLNYRIKFRNINNKLKSINFKIIAKYHKNLIQIINKLDKSLKDLFKIYF